MTSVQEYYDEQWKSAGGDMFASAFIEAINCSYLFLGELSLKKVLEIGSGSGEQAVYFASQGAEVTVIDISLESLKVTEELAKKLAVNITAVPMNAEKLQFADSSFDVVYINSTLMHVDQQRVLQECARVLKKGGKLVIIEPLKYAPLVQLYRLFGSYRKMKPQYATFKMFKEGRNYFSEYEHKEFYLFSSILLPVFSVRSNFLHQLYRGVAKVDNSLMKIFPFLRYGCWVSVVEYKK